MPMFCTPMNAKGSAAVDPNVASAIEAIANITSTTTTKPGGGKCTSAESDENAHLMTCIEASNCPQTHQDSKSCVEHSADDSACAILTVSDDEGHKTKLGKVGHYTSVHDAVDRQDLTFTAPYGASKPSTSVVVNLLPSGAGLIVVTAVKIIEGLALLYMSTRVPLDPRWRIVILVYYLALVHHHLKQAGKRSNTGRRDAFFEKHDMHAIEDVQHVDGDKLVVFHDNGQVAELVGALEPVSKCTGDPACIKYRCCRERY